MLVIVLMFKPHCARSMNHRTLHVAHPNIESGPLGETLLVTKTFPIDLKLILFMPDYLEMDIVVAIVIRTQIGS